MNCHSFHFVLAALSLIIIANRTLHGEQWHFDLENGVRVTLSASDIVLTVKEKRQPAVEVQIRVSRGRTEKIVNKWFFTCDDRERERLPGLLNETKVCQCSDRIAIAYPVPRFQGSTVKLWEIPNWDSIEKHQGEFPVVFADKGTGLKASKDILLDSVPWGTSKTAEFLSEESSKRWQLSRAAFVVHLTKLECVQMNGSNFWKVHVKTKDVEIAFLRPVGHGGWREAE